MGPIHRAPHRQRSATPQRRAPQYRLPWSRPAGFDGQIPLVETTAIDTAVLAFAVLLTVVGAVLCGLAPLVGWRSGSFESRGQTEGVTSMRLRNTLVVSEVAL